MGKEISCCTQTLTNNKDGNFSDTSNASLQEQAKLIHEFDEQNSTKHDHLKIEYDHPTPVKMISDIPPGLPCKRSNSMPKNNKKRISALQRYKRNKSRRLRSTQSSLSLEETLATREIELRQQKRAIKLLRKQNEYLRQGTEKFLLQYGSHFTPTLSTNNKQIIESLKIDVSPIQTMIQTFSQITESVQISPSSPLTPLTNEQTNIILSFSNDSNNIQFATSSMHAVY